ncbi:Serine/threonine-protein phosphatase 2A 65 kDa regulatory subunit A beta isoform [Vitis vinifera]|uniref:Serine/threonine-protein phosphatase 2A 65 kDa regulatory subunit A beta isoform n=1 Tax=Vitis vinifera TaxID=29760 RepID=A0A438IC89_VITVI|nr:Serine/threonine-protein phosphatase 2A 65 kDa regulatory subunit A beta isoform [Vitis vinifera]
MPGGKIQMKKIAIYSQLCQDDMPMVKRSAASNLGKFAATVEAAHSKADIMSIFEDLTQDDQDSVRLLAVKDKSWRVRYMVANQLYELCEAVGPESTRSDLVPAYVWLLHDNEAEVRIAAAGKVTKFCWISNPKLAIPPPPGNDIQAFIDLLNDELAARSPTTDHVEGCDLCLDDFDAQLQLLNAGIK